MLSRESTGIPEAEARALVGDVDPEARFEQPEPGLLIAETSADPATVEARVAFSRRVGTFVPDGELTGGQLSELRRGSYRVRVFHGDGGEGDKAVITAIAKRVDGKVSLKDPDREVSACVGEDGSRMYFAITSPGTMRQGWVTRRPRSRAFFHSSAIFPKLSRALVNLSGVQPGETFLDPFCGTGSLLIEASIVGAEPLGVDLARKMVRGARRNSIKYGQPWLGIIRANTMSLPLTKVGGAATDIPYGRVSSREGRESAEILRSLVDEARRVVPEGKKLVVMHPKSIETRAVADTEGFDIEQELDIYVHRTLTRRITVLRRGGAG